MVRQAAKFAAINFRSLRPDFILAGLLLVSISGILTACTFPKIRSTINPALTKSNPRIGIISNNVLADAIGTELIQYGIVVVERARLQSIFREDELILTGAIKQEELQKISELLKVDLLMFVTVTTEQDFPSKVGSATVKLVDAQSGALVGGVSYQNGRGGAPGSPADADMKEALPESAQRIAKAIASGLKK